MIEEKTNKKKQIIMSILVASLVLIITGVTYAVFSYSNSSINNNNTIKSGQVTMTYSEQSNSYIVENALPKKDAEGMNENNYFEFTVTSSAKTNATDTVGIQIPYEINLSSKAIEEGKQQLQEENIKVYLTKVENGKEVGVIAPTKISELGNSIYRENATKLAYKLNAHKNGNETITTKYRLRAWIDYDTDITNWSENNKYQYKFTVNINSDTKYVGYTTDPACFTYEDDGNGGKKITGFSSTCSATNLVIPSTYKEPTVIPETTGPVLLSYTANEEEWIKMWKNDLLEEGQTYEDYLAANSLTDEQVIAEAKEGLKEMTTEFDSYVGKVITGTESTTEVIYNMLQDPNNEGYAIYSKIFTMNVETKTIPEHTENKDYKVTYIDTEDFQSRNIKTVVLPDDIVILTHDIFKGNTIDLFVNNDGNLPSGSYKIIEQNGKKTLRYLNFIGGIKNVDLSNLNIDDINITLNGTSDIELIQFPSTLKEITAFNGGTKIKSLDLSNTQLTSLSGYGMFSNNQIISIKLPNTLTVIGNYVFQGNKLESLDLSNTQLTTIGSGAFTDNQLTSIKLPNTLTTIDQTVFEDNKIKSLDLSNTQLTTIGNSAFSNNQLTNVKLPNTLTAIGDYAFENNKIKSLDLSNTKLTSVESRTFSNNQLTNVKLPNTLTNLKELAFSNNQITSIDFSTALTTIGNFVFQNNKIENLDLSNTKVTSIGGSAFNGNKITTVKFPNTLTTINSHAFNGNKIENLDMSNTKLETIDIFAFSKNNLTTIKLPATIKTMGNRAFDKSEYSNTNLTSIIYPGTTAFNWDDIIGSIAAGTTTHLPPYTYNGVSITAN